MRPVSRLRRSIATRRSNGQHDQRRGVTMKVRDLMTTDPLTVSPDTAAYELGSTAKVAVAT